MTAVGRTALAPYVVCADGEVAPGLDRIDPLRAASSGFLDLLQRLDALVRGARGMALPRWAFLDCAELPGLIAGFTCDGADLPPAVRERMEVPDHRAGAVPVSLVAAIPMLAPGAWHVYALSCLEAGWVEKRGGQGGGRGGGQSPSGTVPGTVPGAIEPAFRSEGLAASTLDLALRASGASVAYAATQWGDPDLEAFARYAPLDLLTAWTPAHTDPATLTFRFEVRAAHPARGTRPDRWIGTGDAPAQRALQALLEGGARCAVVGAPRRDRGAMEVPLRMGRPK